jgi:ABC-type transport system involved in multi-copper enzyme maturation permease subunit
MEAPRTPAQQFALIMGALLLALGVLTLIIGGVHFGTATQARGQNFLIWLANGWDSVLWIVFGALGIATASRVDASRTYALVTGVVFAVLAVWGFITGGSVFNLLSVDTTDNITHAIVGGLGLVLGVVPKSARETVKAMSGDRPGRREAHGSA